MPFTDVPFVISSRRAIFWVLCRVSGPNSFPQSGGVCLWCRPGNCNPGPNPKPYLQVSKHPAFQMVLYSPLLRGLPGASDAAHSVPLGCAPTFGGTAHDGISGQDINRHSTSGGWGIQQAHDFDLSCCLRRNTKLQPASYRAARRRRNGSPRKRPKSTKNERPAFRCPALIVTHFLQVLFGLLPLGWPARLGRGQLLGLQRGALHFGRRLDSASICSTVGSAVPAQPARHESVHTGKFQWACSFPAGRTRR